MTSRLHTAIDGPDDAPVLVLGGSLGTTAAMWQPQLDVLTKRFRVLRYDHRGHGGSERPPGPYSLAELGTDLLAVLDEFAIGRASHGGLSLGGMVAMWVAANAPERVDRLALLCTSAMLGPAQGWLDRAAAVRTGGTDVVADPVTARWFTPGFAAARPEVVARHRAMLVATPAEGYAGCCEAIAAMDLRGELARIAAPTLVIAGADDPATPPHHAETIVDGIPHARLAMVEAAHLANVEQPEAVNRLLVDHLVAGPGAPAGSLSG